MADASVISVLLRAKDETARVFQTAENNAGKMAAAFEKHRRAIGLAMTAAGGAIAAVGLSSLKAASDVEEMRNKFNVVFKDLADGVEDWAQKSGDATGTSSFKLMEYAARLQDTFVPMGVAREEAAKMSMQITELGVDLGSFNNIPTADVMRDLTSAMVGNTEGLLKYGVVANAAAIETKALELGLIDEGEALDANSKAQAILAITMASTTDAQGDAARSIDSYAGQMRQLSKVQNELQVELGTLLLPMMTKLVTVASSITGAIGSWTRENEGLASVLVPVTTGIGGLLLVLGPMLIILPSLVTGIRMVGVALATLGAAGGPVMLALAAVAAIVVTLQKFLDTNREVQLQAGSELDIAQKRQAHYIELNSQIKAIDLSTQKYTEAYNDLIAAGFTHEQAMEKEIQMMEMDLAQALETTVAGNEEVAFSLDNVSLALGETAVQSDEATRTFIANMGKQEVAVKTFEEAAIDIAELNAKAERDIRNRKTEEFLAGLEESARAREQAADHAIREARRAADAQEREMQRVADAQKLAHERQTSSWNRFFEEQHPIMLQLEEENLRFADVVALMAEDAGVSLVQMGEDVRNAGVTWGETFDLINSDVATNMQGIINKVKEGADEVKNASSNMNSSVVAMAAATNLDVGGRSISADRMDRAMETFNTRMSHAPLSENEIKTIERIQTSGGDLADLGGRYMEMAKMAGLANGGFIRQGGMALVGERGPEIVSLPSGSTVHPNGTGPGGGTNNFHFHGAVYGVEDLKEAVVQAVRDHAISGGFTGVFGGA